MTRAMVPASFGIAIAACMVLTPLMRRAAFRWGFVDHPTENQSYKLHKEVTPLLGGASILVAIAVASAWTGAWRSLGGIALGVAMLAVVGLLDDMWDMPLSVRLPAEILAAVVAVALGIQADATGVLAIDFAISVLWIVGITNAVNVIDNCNGITAGTVALASAAFSFVALSEGQIGIAVIAASTTGAALGFLPFNFPKAKIFLGDAGTLPLGFLVAIIGLETDISIGIPWGFVVPVCILALPIVNTMVVSIHRLRIGQPIYVGGVDSLWHRLVLLGFSRTGAVLVLLAVAAMMGATATAAAMEFAPRASPVVALVVAGLAGLKLLSVAIEEHPRTVNSEGGTLVSGPAA